MDLFKPFRKKPAGRRRKYDIAKLAQNQRWIFGPVNAAEEVRSSLASARNVARKFERDNDHVRKFLSMFVTNTQTVKFQCKAKDADGTLDKIANDAVKRAWTEWGKIGNCTANRRQTFKDVQTQIRRGFARDGEFIVRMLPGWPGNKFRFAVQVLDPAMLDENFNRNAGYGRNRVVMGVELDQWEAPVRYHFKQNTKEIGGHHAKHTEIPADQIIHGYVEEVPGQGRGITLMCSAATKLHHLKGYEEAEVIGARASACKMGFFEETTPQDWEGADEEQEPPVMEGTPGTFEKLPQGWKFADYDPTHPHAETSDFSKCMLRSIANGLAVSYNTFANDLENVNFSSIRDGNLKEQDMWMLIQDWFIEHFEELLFSEWLRYALLAGAVVTERGRPLPYSKFDKFNKPEFSGKRWPWVRPLEEAKAKELYVKRGWTSDSEVAAEKGNDWDEIQAQKENDAESRFIDPMDNTSTEDS